MTMASNNPTRRELLTLAVALPVGAALLAACGATSTTSGTAASSAASTSASAAKATSTSAVKVTSTSKAAAAAMGPKPTPTPAAGETHKGAATTIDLWYGWGGATAIATWKALTPKMADALTGFNVHWIVADNNTKLLTAIAGGSPPGVAVGNAPYSEFWARGAAQPLDAYIAKSKVINRTDIPEPYWSFASYKGKTYGVPEVESFVRFGLCLDMTNLRKYNIDPKTFSWDWDTLTKLQQETTVKAANGSIKILGIDPLDAMGGGFGGANPFYWGLAWKIQYYDEANNTYNFDNPQLVDALTVLKKVYDIAGGARVIAGFHSSYGTWTESPTAAMPAGVENANINGYWAPGELAHSSPHREFAFTWAPVPASEKGFKFQALCGHQGFIPRGAKHQDDAFQVIEFLAGDVAEQVIFDNTGWLGARQSFLKKVNVNKYKGLDFYVSSVTTANKLYGMPSDPIEGFVAQQWKTAQSNVLYGKSTPQAALRQLQQIVTNELKQEFPNG